MRPAVLMSFAGLLAVVATASAQQSPPPTPTPSSAVATPQTPPPGQPPATQQTPPPGQPPATVPTPTPAPGQQQGQRGQQGGQGQPPPPGRGTAPSTVPVAPPAMAPRPEPPSSWQNVKIDVSILDTVTADVQTRKTISMLILDGRSGQIRSSGGTNSLINVDAAPTIRQDGRIYLHLTMEYQPELTPQQNQALIKDGIGRLPIFMESLALILVDGKMMVASQSADPRSDRKVSVEITATVQK
jgi:hypothetical protein